MILCAASSKTIIEIRVFKSLTILMKCDLRLAGEHARRLAERERVTKIRRDDPQAITDQASLLTSE